MAGQNQSGCALDASESVDPAYLGFAAASDAGPGRQGLGRPRQRRRLSRHGAGLRPGRDVPAPWSIWSNAMPRRPPFCAKRCGLPTRQAPFIWRTSGIVWIEWWAGSIASPPARLLRYTSSSVSPNRWSRQGAKALFLKGQDVEAELTEATKYWNIRYRTTFQPHRRTRLDRRTRSDRAARLFRQQPMASRA